MKTELRWDVHETKDTSSQLPSTAEGALMQLAVMAKDAPLQLPLMTNKTDTGPDSGSNGGSGSGNSSRVYAQVSADYHPAGMQSAECHAGRCKSMICVHFFMLHSYTGTKKDST